MSALRKRTCKECNGTGIIKVLGSGGDYEWWPCPKCHKREYETSTALIYGAADGEAE